MSKIIVTSLGAGLIALGGSFTFLGLELAPLTVNRIGISVTALGVAMLILSNIGTKRADAYSIKENILRFRDTLFQIRHETIACALSLAVAICVLCITAFLLKSSFIYNTDMNIANMLHYSSLKAAQEGGEYDLVIIGDSSVGSGVDTPLLSQLTHKKILNLHSTGTATPNSYSLYLDEFFNSGGKTKAILFLLQPESLEFDKNIERFSEIYHELFKNDSNGHALQSLQKFRLPIRYVFPVPMPGKWGRYYGSIFNFYARSNALGRSWVDPGEKPVKEIATYDIMKTTKYLLDRGGCKAGPELLDGIEPNGFYRKALLNMINNMNSKFDGVFAFSYMPTLTNALYCIRINTAAPLKNIFVRGGIAFPTYLNIPVGLPEKYMATNTHCNVNGKKLLTYMIAQEINTRLNLR